MTRRLPLFLLLAGIPCSAQAQDTLVAIRNLAPRQLRAAYFVLDAPEDVLIDAVGGEPRGRSAVRRFLEHGVFQSREEGLWDPRVWPANAWILDARTREVVWELRTATPRREGGLRRFAGTVRLPAGTYEVQYAALFPVSKFWNDRGDWRVRYDREPPLSLHGPYLDDGTYRQFRLTVRGEGRRVTAREAAEAQTTVVSLHGMMGESREKVGFSLDRPAAVEVYVVGEKSGGDWNDYGWIMNADTRETVWSAEDEPGEPAGGAMKNRMIRRALDLPAGRYVGFYATDDSHHAGAWNETPPYDPSGWGLALRVATSSERGAIKPFEYQPVPPAAAFVSLTGLKDDELRWQRFALKRPMDVRIFAVGESTDGRLHDHGWIVDGAGRAAWRMEFGATRHAGGARKNRLFDGTVHLEAGHYVAYFVTDGSHSGGSGWNADRPVDDAYWGITLLPASGRADPAATRLDDGASDPAILARIVQVRDQREERASFALERPSAVRVYGVGEGDGQMFDYGWIEDAAGREVWRMKYGETEPAGGAHKNRKVDQLVTLPPGTYTAHFRTDRGHAFRNWNADPPDDPLSWGITVSREESRKR